MTNDSIYQVMSALKKIKLNTLLWLALMLSAACGQKSRDVDYTLRPADTQKPAEQSDTKQVNVTAASSDRTNPELCIASVKKYIKSYCDQDDAVWQAAFANGTRIGYTSYSLTVKDNIAFTCDNASFNINRAETELTLNTSIIYKETKSGRPLACYMAVTGSGMNQYSCGTVHNTSLKIENIVGGRLSTDSIDLPKNTLFAEGVRQKMLESAGKSNKITLKVFDPLTRESEDVIYSLLHSNKQTLDMDILAYELKESTPGKEVKSRVWFNSKMFAVKTVGNLAGINFKSFKTDKEAALLQEPGRLPFDIFSTSLLESPAILSKKIRKGTLSYRIIPLKINENSDNKLNFVNSKEQSVTLQNNRYTVDITNINVPDAAMIYNQNDPEIIKYLKPGTWIQSDAVEIKKISKRLFNGVVNAQEAVKKTEKFVPEFIVNTGMATAYESALDVVKNRAGDCTEYALFTAALFKAAHVPARVGFGIVYTENNTGNGVKAVFAGHAWTTYI
jgi:hypothetical protein